MGLVAAAEPSYAQLSGLVGRTVLVERHAAEGGGVVPMLVESVSPLVGTSGWVGYTARLTSPETPAMRTPGTHVVHGAESVFRLVLAPMPSATGARRYRADLVQVLEAAPAESARPATVASIADLAERRRLRRMRHPGWRNDGPGLG